MARFRVKRVRREDRADTPETGTTEGTGRDATVGESATTQAGGRPVGEVQAAEQPTVRERAVEERREHEATTREGAEARDRDRAAAAAGERETREVMRVPGFAPIAPFGGWLAAWGAAALAALCLIQAGLDMGFGLGIAEGGPGDDDFGAGVVVLIVQAVAFLIGGYVAARMARGRGVIHAVLAWVVAMIATGADAIVLNLRDGGESVVSGLPFVPFWENTGLGSGGDAVVALGAFALAALIGAIVGGMIGAAGNRAARREIVEGRDYRAGRAG
jgi:hypothetical protein